MRNYLRNAPLRLLVGIAALLSFSSAGAAPASPSDIFGFQPGDDYKLASYEQMEVYYRQLAQESDRVQLREIGKTPLGRNLYLLTISSVDSETAASLANEGKSVVWIDGGLHATEVAHGQMTSLLAHRVATEESVEMNQIRDNVIFLLMPVMNPDGLEIVRKWYESQLGTAYEQTTPPELYHHYVGHDNNRDFFM